MPDAQQVYSMAKQILKIAVVLVLVALIWKLVVEEDEPASGEEVDRID